LVGVALLSHLLANLVVTMLLAHKSDGLEVWGRAMDVDSDEQVLWLRRLYKDARLLELVTELIELSQDLGAHRVVKV
jgi:hypothetical protein